MGKQDKNNYVYMLNKDEFLEKYKSKMVYFKETDKMVFFAFSDYPDEAYVLPKKMKVLGSVLNRGINFYTKAEFNYLVEPEFRKLYKIEVLND